MPSVIVNSSNINTFCTNIYFNIYEKSIYFDASCSTYNGSSMSGIFNVQGIALSVQDSDGVVLAFIDWNAPQIPDPASNPTYTLDLSSLNYAFLFQQYKIICAIRDQDGNVYQTVPVIKQVCEPVNFTDSGYVPGMFQVQADCNDNNLSIKDLTVYVYNNNRPYSTVSKNGTLYYPTGTISAINFTGTPFSNNVIYTGQYRITCTSVATYDIQDGVYINVTYITDNVFDITCSNKLADLMCCIVDLQMQYQRNCNNAIGENSFQQLQLITVPLLTGLIKEINGQDASYEYELIKKTLKCNCGVTSIKQNEITPINPSVYNIVIQGVGGTTVPNATTIGNTKTYTIASNVYIVAKGDTGDQAFTIKIDTSSQYITKYLITFDYAVMAQYILNAISNSPTLTAQLNSLITATTNIDLSNLDGVCVINMSDVNYFLSYRSPNNSVVVKNIVIGVTTYNAPANLLITNTTGIEGWLNGLGLGVWNASYSNSTSGVFSNIATNNNSNNPVSVTYTTPSGDIVVLFQKTTKSLVAVLQAIIDYLCNITALQITLGNNLALCTFDYNGNLITTGYDTNSSQNDFNSGVATAICNLAQRIQTVSAVTCDTIKSKFIDSPLSVFNISSDRLLSIVGGNCVALNAQQFATAVISAINTYSAVKTAFCAINCTTPGTCPDVTANNLGVSNGSIGVYGVTWTQNPTVTQTVTVKYRINGTQNWTIATNNLSVSPNGNVQGTSPYLITGLIPNTTYDVQIINNCGGSGFISQISTPTSGIISGSYLLDTSIYNICGDSPITLYSATNFGTGTILYFDNSLLTPATGYNFVVPVATGHVYTMDSSNAAVGTDTGNICGAGTAGTYILGNDTSTICSGTPQTLYTSGAFAVGGTLYYDSALTTVVTGYSYVLQSSTNKIYNLNSSTGQIGSDTSLSCTTNTVRITSTMVGTQISGVSGITGFTPSPSFPLSVGGTITGTHSSFTGTILVTVTGTPTINPSNLELTVNGVVVQCIPVTSSGSFLFASRAYASTDIIQIYANTGGCPS